MTVKPRPLLEDRQMDAQTWLDPAEAWRIVLGRAERAEANGEVFSSPNLGKPYRVTRTPRNNISVIRIGRDNNESPVTLSPKIVTDIIDLLNSKGGRCFRKDLQAPYGLHNVLADLHPRIRVDVDAKQLFVLGEATSGPIPEMTQPASAPILLASPEGKRLLRLHRTRERDPNLVKEKKRLAKIETGNLACVVCGFDFGSRYGPHGDGFIECHHTNPLSARLEEEETRLEDLELVCANCHRMLHRGKVMLSIHELRAMLRPAN